MSHDTRKPLNDKLSQGQNQGQKQQIPSQKQNVPGGKDREGGAINRPGQQRPDLGKEKGKF